MSTYVPEEWDTPQVREKLILLGQHGKAVPGYALMGVKELADFFEVTNRAVGYWLKKGAPAPVVTLSMGKIYDVREFMAWREENKSTPVDGSLENDLLGDD